MGPGEAVIAFIVVGLPVIIGFMLVSRLLRHREKRMELEARIAEANAGRQSVQAGRIEERLRVLERIVTEKGHGLADEIERLRLPTE